MKLIKLSDIHYIVVSDEEINEGDYYYSCPNGNNSAIIKNEANYFDPATSKKIVASTNGEYNVLVTYIPLEEVQELLGVIIPSNKVKLVYPEWYTNYDSHKKGIGFVKGYKQALEDNKDKQFTKEDLKKAFRCGAEFTDYRNGECFLGRRPMGLDQMLESMSTSKTEWEVEYDSNGKLKFIL